MNFTQEMLAAKIGHNFNQQKDPMANRDDKTPENVPGAYYVDDTCIDCDLCRSNAPEFFKREESAGYTIVYRQPVTPEEIAQAENAQLDCPTESIGNDGLE